MITTYTYADIPWAVRNVLDITYQPTGVVMWWTSRNRMLGMHRPCELWATEPGAVIQLARDLEGVGDG